MNEARGGTRRAFIPRLLNSAGGEGEWRRRTPVVWCGWWPRRRRGHQPHHTRWFGWWQGRTSPPPPEPFDFPPGRRPRVALNCGDGCGPLFVLRTKPQPKVKAKAKANPPANRSLGGFARPERRSGGRDERSRARVRPRVGPRAGSHSQNDAGYPFATLFAACRWVSVRNGTCRTAARTRSYLNSSQSSGSIPKVIWERRVFGDRIGLCTRDPSSETT